MVGDQIGNLGDLVGHQAAGNLGMGRAGQDGFQAIAPAAPYAVDLQGRPGPGPP
jgi:hypothetical protein